ncbi:MarR family winged helix-turn-helix transcriptional regulator [Methylobacterium sp. NEAU K]|uniref:MarR family winged helix-turn-helix transcriptional regulator n=1 Tax=Methylobacterium sp. NEAU K TaxID=3064946 RepID=UPI00273609A7|nr:MarR family transcriptional regulator [Methylobacterium sp. NEAU K]MDP4002659.1 MarR family transcriptional regulator [Methylobacterium sp. NEAU K]
MSGPTASQSGAAPNQAGLATVDTSSQQDRQRLDNQLCFAVYAAAHAFGRAYRNLLGRHELTYPQYLVLLVLWEEDGLSVKEIGNRLFLDSGTLTPLLKRLEASGRVRRARDRVDERQVSIFLTPAGQKLRDVLACIPDEAGELTGLDVQGRQNLLNDLITLRLGLQGGLLP